MIGMGFFSFLWLLLIALVVSVVTYFVPIIKIQLPGGYPTSLIFAWVGAWLGTPVFGKWLPVLTFDEVALIPAVLGSIVTVLLADAWTKFRGYKMAQ